MTHIPFFFHIYCCKMDLVATKMPKVFAELHLESSPYFNLKADTENHASNLVECQIPLISFLLEGVGPFKTQLLESSKRSENI